MVLAAVGISGRDVLSITITMPAAVGVKMKNLLLGRRLRSLSPVVYFKCSSK